MSLRKPFRATPVKLGAVYRAREATEHHNRRVFVTLMILGPIAAFGIIWAVTPLYLARANAPLPVRSSLHAAALSESVHYSGCNEVRAAGAAPLYREEPGYRPEMDGDGDGIACEPHRDEAPTF